MFKDVINSFFLNFSPLPKTPEVTATYPERPVAGFLPAVRLGRREVPLYSPASRTIGRSPNTVKIAPPDPRRMHNTRLKITLKIFMIHLHFVPYHPNKILINASA